MILLTLGVEALARLMEPEERVQDSAWLLFGLADDQALEEPQAPAE